MWEELRERRERALRLSAADAISAGATGELGRIQQQIGDVFTKVLLAFATEDLGLARDDPVVLEALPRRLLELTG